MRVSGDKKTSPPGKSINNQMGRRKSSRLRLNNPYDEITIARSRRMGDDDDGSPDMQNAVSHSPPQKRGETRRTILPGMMRSP